MRSVLTKIDDDVDHSLDDKNTLDVFHENKSLEREMKKPTNFSLLLLLRLSFYVVDRQPTTKEDRQILSSSSSLSFFRVQMRGRKEEEVKEANAKLLFLLFFF